MSNIDCSACDDLRELSPDFVENGVTTAICTSLKNDTGINSKLTVLHNDCTDLNMINDCLIGKLQDDIEAYEVCDWKKFMRRFIPNIYELIKAMICAICGIWTNIHSLWDAINALKEEIKKIWAAINNLIGRVDGLESDVSKIKTDISNLWDAINSIEEAATYRSYDGILTLTTTSAVYGEADTSPQTLPFNKSTREGNMPSSVLQPTSGYDGIVVKNTLKVPILVTATFNSSIATDQNIACCYIVTTRDGNHVGQTPFITPHSYDQQTTSKPFVLKPGQSATMSYYFAIGSKNAWYKTTFGFTTGEERTGTRCLLEAASGDEREQPSYFAVEARSFLIEDE